MTPLEWKEKMNRHGALSSTARAPRLIGGNYVVAQFLSGWNVDYHNKKRSRTPRQIGFACAIEDAKALAQKEVEAINKLTWVGRPAKLDTARYEAELGDRKPPYRIRVRTVNGKAYFIVSRGARHYATVRSLEQSKAVAEANYQTASKGQ